MTDNSRPWHHSELDKDSPAEETRNLLTELVLAAILIGLLVFFLTNAVW